MSDFFSLSTGESAISESGSFEASTSIPPIPDNTDVVATPDEAKWAEYDGVNYISIRWSIVSPKEYAGRKVFQKIYATEPKPGAKDPAAAMNKAKQMFLAIDKNAGGHIAAAGVTPTDESLTKFLLNKMMVLKLLVWEMNDKTGNWIGAVSPKKKGPPVAVSQASTPSAQSQANAMGVGQPIDEDIPF